MKWVITKDVAGYSVQKFLKDKHAFSRRLLRSLKDDGGSIEVNSELLSFRYKLQEGDIVNVTFPSEKVAAYMEPAPIPLTIIYEDEELMVVNKEAGMATLPSRNHPSHTLANGILAYYRDKGIRSTIHIVTRLDKDTSGLVLIAKNRYIHGLFARMQQSHLIKRTYIAIVNGQPVKQRGVINAPIGRKEGSIIERTVTFDGKEAITDYNILHTDVNGDYSFAEIGIHTGRTHQIRVHMAYIVHPLIGDDLYSEKHPYIDRQALHCYRLTFQHPLTKHELTIEAPIPADMSVFYKHG
ncbi:MAG TPA: RluA family pseudouridine synthase [Bacillota bacterium]|nr:RluA family pseudouridine synthase [Bacillota bacterium]